MGGELAERNDAKLLNQLAPAAFSLADKTFRFISWAIILTVLRYAHDVTDSPYLFWLLAFCYWVFGVALLLTAMEMPVKDLSHLDLPDWAIALVRISLAVLGFALLLVVSSPFLVVDQLITDLGAVRPAN